MEPIRKRPSSAKLAATLLGFIAIFLAFAAVASAATTLTADYRFNDTHASSAATPPVLADLGPGTNAFAAETVDGTARRVLAFPQNNGLSLTPTTGVVQNGAYTVVVLARLHDVAGFRRLLDFKAGTSDTGLYAYNGSLFFYPVTGGTTAPITADAYHQIVLTRTSAGTVTGYVDGVQQFSFDDSSSQYGAIDSNSTLRLFRDNESGGASTEASAGAVARVRLFNDALGSSAVAALNREPALLKLDPTGGGPGTPVDARAYGFSPGETVRLSFVDTTGGAKSVTSLGRKTADALGNIDKSVTIPVGASTDPTDKIKAKGVSSGLVATKKFTVS